MVGGFILTYNLEYRKNILFIRIQGSVNSCNIDNLNNELNNMILNLGINNIVYNFEEVTDIDNFSINTFIKWNKIIKKRKGVNYVCGVKSLQNKSNLLNYISEISNELCAIRVINWNN